MQIPQGQRCAADIEFSSHMFRAYTHILMPHLKTLPGKGLAARVDGETVAAAVKKWGLESDMTDEKVSREGISYVARGLQRLGNSVIKRVDSVAMAVILAKITSTFGAVSPWTTAGRMVEAVTTIRTQRADLGTGHLAAEGRDPR